MDFFSYPVETHRFFNKDLSTDISSCFLDLIHDKRISIILKIIIDKNGDKVIKEERSLQRLKKELQFFYSSKFPNELDFLLVMEEVAFLYESKNKIINIGRGKSAYSYLYFCLGLSKINPLEFKKMNFETYIGRDLGIDHYIDVPDTEGFEFVKSKYSSFFKEVRSKRNNSLLSCFRKVIEDRESFIQLRNELWSLESSIKENVFTCILSDKKIFDLLIKESPFVRSFFNNNPELVNHVKFLLAEPVWLTVPWMFTLLKSDDTILDKEDLQGMSTISFLHNRVLRSLSENMELSSFSASNNDFNHLINSTFSIQGFKNVIESKHDSLKCFNNYREVAQKWGFPSELSSIEDMCHYFVLMRCPPSFYKYREKIYSSFNFLEKIKAFTSDSYGLVLYQDQIIDILSHFLNFSLSKSMDVRSSMLPYLRKEITFSDLTYRFEFPKDLTEDFFEFLSILNMNCVSRGHFLNETISKYFVANLK